MGAMDFWVQHSPAAKVVADSDAMSIAEKRFGLLRRAFLQFAATLVASMGLAGAGHGALRCGGGARAGAVR